jgi:hypothetical protein
MGRRPDDGAVARFSSLAPGDDVEGGAQRAGDPALEVFNGGLAATHVSARIVMVRGEVFGESAIGEVADGGGIVQAVAFDIERL